MRFFEHIKTFFSNLFNKRKALPEPEVIQEEVQKVEIKEQSEHDKFVEKVKKPTKKIAHKKLKYVETLRFGGDGLGLKKNVRY